MEEAKKEVENNQWIKISKHCSIVADKVIGIEVQPIEEE